MFVDVENREILKWFSTLLHEHLGDYVEDGWNFISNMQKVINNIYVGSHVMFGAPIDGYNGTISFSVIRYQGCSSNIWKFGSPHA